VKLVSAALVVTVQKHDFRPDLVFLPSVQVFNARETDEMFLESASCFGANALLFGPDWDPIIFPHSFENRGSRKKAVPIRNTFDWLRSEKYSELNTATPHQKLLLFHELLKDN